MIEYNIYVTISHDDHALIVYYVLPSALSAMSSVKRKKKNNKHTKIITPFMNKSLPYYEIALQLAIKLLSIIMAILQMIRYNSITSVTKRLINAVH